MNKREEEKDEIGRDRKSDEEKGRKMKRKEKKVINRKREEMKGRWGCKSGKQQKRMEFWR